MLLSEAARTGRKFRRKSVAGWWVLEGKEVFEIQPDGLRNPYNFNAEEIVANDWEPEPLALTITADDLIRAARAFDDIASKRKLSAVEFAKLLCQNLGLTEEK